LNPSAATKCLLPGIHCQLILLHPSPGFPPIWCHCNPTPTCPSDLESPITPHPPVILDLKFVVKTPKLVTHAITSAFIATVTITEPWSDQPDKASSRPKNSSDTAQDPSLHQLGIRLVPGCLIRPPISADPPTIKVGCLHVSSVPTVPHRCPDGLFYLVAPDQTSHQTILSVYYRMS
jgi:hypothetical protein